MTDRYDLQRFVNAQDPVYESVCAELRNGRKESHWIWFIFPQLRGLGHSSMAHRFGISSRQEAVEYLAHPVLRARLEECTGLVNRVGGRTISQILGYPDDLKFRSSMSLFATVTPGHSIFKDALEKYFDAEADFLTLDLLGAQKKS